MKSFFPTMALLGLLLAAGCVPSLHPLVAKDEAQFAPELVGVWAPEGKAAETLTLTRWDATSPLYRAEHVDEDGRKGAFEVRATRLAEVLFLDFYPLEPNPDLNGFYKMHLVPAHTFLRAALLDDGTLRLDLLKPGWLDQQLAADPTRIANERLEDGDGRLLTAPTAKLREFISAIAKNDEAWGQGTPLRRQPPPPPAATPPPAKPAPPQPQ